MNTFMNNLNAATNYRYTENGAVTHVTTGSKVLDLFAQGGAYRNRSNEDCIVLFKKAFQENETLALKCLFYLRDVRGGQGERRFFRVCLKWLAENYPERIKDLIQYVPEYGRYDDWFELLDTDLEETIIDLVKNQLMLDMSTETNGISLLAKWCPSRNASSNITKAKGKKICEALNLTSKQYRQMLSKLRAKINVLERLMSANQWGLIEFEKIPSKAGIKYRNAFARRDIIAKKYEAFTKDKSTKVNAKTLYPYEIAERAFKEWRMPVDSPERLMLQKYWDGLEDYYQGREENGLAIVDVSGSMSGRPMSAAVSMGAYIAEKAHGPFANHFITFSGNPQLVEFEGVDITDKFVRCRQAEWGMNTNIEAVFELLLSVARKENTKPEDMCTRLYIFSDMEFDKGLTCGPISRDRWGWSNRNNTLRSEDTINILFESIAKKWAVYGYKLPSVIFWNLDARHDNIPAIGEGFSYVSGFSPVMVQQILSGKDGIDLMLDKLNSERYNVIK